jgi:glycosyltransferase involved in cell wall biosynthesis
MLANFGRADGGRATWAYNFIPRLLARYPDLRLNVLGLRVEGDPDNSGTVLSCVPEKDRDRMSVEFVSARADRIPNALAYWKGLPKIASPKPAPDFFIAVGSWVELLAALRVERFRGAGKIVWLRTIFADEKAHRYPAFLRPLLERVEIAVLRRADLIIANGKDTAEHYRKFGLKIEVIPNGVELDRWRMKPARIAGPIDVLYVGRLAPVKGIEDFIRVAEAARGRGLDWLRFHVIGGPRLPIVEKAHSDGSLRYEGAVPNERMPNALSAMPVCVALTYVRSGNEHFSGGAGVSHGLLEQMAAGRVIVAWDNAAFRQVLCDDSAIFVRQGDREALLNALIEIRADPASAERRAANAARVAEDYGFERHFNRFESAAAQWLLPGAVKPE